MKKTQLIISDLVKFNETNLGKSTIIKKSDISADQQ